jgi:hypothetical protein
MDPLPTSRRAWILERAPPETTEATSFNCCDAPDRARQTNKTTLQQPGNLETSTRLAPSQRRTAPKLPVFSEHLAVPATRDPRPATRNPRFQVLKWPALRHGKEQTAVVALKGTERLQDAASQEPWWLAGDTSKPAADEGDIEASDQDTDTCPYRARWDSIIIMAGH